MPGEPSFSIVSHSAIILSFPERDIFAVIPRRKSLVGVVIHDGYFFPVKASTPKGLVKRAISIMKNPDPEDGKEISRGTSQEVLLVIKRDEKSTSSEIYKIRSIPGSWKWRVISKRDYPGLFEFLEGVGVDPSEKTVLIYARGPLARVLSFLFAVPRIYDDPFNLVASSLSLIFNIFPGDLEVYVSKRDMKLGQTFSLQEALESGLVSPHPAQLTHRVEQPLLALREPEELLQIYDTLKRR